MIPISDKYLPPKLLLTRDNFQEWEANTLCILAFHGLHDYLLTEPSQHTTVKQKQEAQQAFALVYSLIGTYILESMTARGIIDWHDINLAQVWQWLQAIFSSMDRREDGDGRDSTGIGK